MENLELLIQVACLIIFILTFASLFGRFPYLELATHFRFQYVWLSIICLVILLLLNSWVFVFLAIVTTLLNGFLVIPYYYPRTDSENDEAAQSLKVMLANVEYRNQRYDKLLKSVKSTNPDILILQELTEEWWENVLDLRLDYPHFESELQERGAGLAVLSKYPIEYSETLDHDKPTRPSIFCKIEVNGIILSLLTIHPPTPMGLRKFSNRNKNFTQTAKIMRDAQEPKLLIGDLNMTMWSPYFSDLVKRSGLRDVRIGKGLKTTWISFFPSPFRIAIDHCLVGENIKLGSIEVGDSTGSDHLSLIVNLKIKGLV